MTTETSGNARDLSRETRATLHPLGAHWGAVMPPETPEPEPETANDPAAEWSSTVSLVIPAKNEARNLPWVLENLPDGLDEVILVDGGSKDVSLIAAKSSLPGIRIIVDPNPGKGNALRHGFAAAEGEIIVAMDADGSMSPQEIPQYVYFLEHGYDFVKGSRFVGGGGSLDITALRKAGNRGLLAAANLLFSARFTDLCYGFFAFKSCYLDSLDLHSTGFEIETELTVRAAVMGLRIGEVPSLELPRRTGRSSLHAIRDGQRVLKTLLRERQRAAAAPAAKPTMPVEVVEVNDPDEVAEVISPVEPFEAINSPEAVAAAEGLKALGEATD